MKNTILFCSLIFLFFACSSDDDNANSPPDEPNLESKLLGTWKYAAISINGTALPLDDDNCLLDNEIIYSPNSELIYNLASLNGNEDCNYSVFETFWIVESPNTYLSALPGSDEGTLINVEFLSDNRILLEFIDNEVTVETELIRI
jgi:hypothetical protein